MTNIILISNGSRPRLLEQALRTMYDNTPANQFTLTIVFDGTNLDEVNDYSSFVLSRLKGTASIIALPGPCNIVGRLKNLGAYWSEKQFGRGEWLCFLDDDMALFPGWLENMIAVADSTNQLRLLGGVRHPYHGVNLGESRYGFGWEITDAVAGYCHFMRWSTWDRFGPYDAHAKGTGQSEDFVICRKIVDAGGKVGYIHPPAMAHCGLTNSEGKPILGGELIERIPNVIYE